MGEDKDRAGASTEENSPKCILPYLNEIDEDEYLAVLDNLLAVKRKSVHAENEYELNNKLVRFALSRGFEMKDIRHCITLSDENDELE